jgi:hypothetical protein
MNKLEISITFLVLLFVAFCTGCTEDEAVDLKAGTLVLKITDAASDDANIKSIYLTVSKIFINGKPARNFAPQTIEISALRNGITKILLSKELPAKEYGQISLVLSSNSSNVASMPGCYVLTKDNKKHNLFTGTATELEIPVSKSFELLPGNETKLVVDFDLRKAVIRKTTGISGYSFVSISELEKAVRIVHEENTGKITGEVKANLKEETEIYVLVYRKGEFKASTEGTGTGKSNILFANAVSSTKVESDGSYHLAFLEEGEYEIHLASFTKNNDDIFTFHGFLQSTRKRTGTVLSSISVSAGSALELNIEVFNLF